MLSDDSKAFTKDNINLFFRDLSKEYKRLGGKNTPVEIILIGGAAIIESYGFREMTTDIDAVLPDVSSLKHSINGPPERRVKQTDHHKDGHAS